MAKAMGIPSFAAEHACKPLFGREALHEALELVRQMDPVGWRARPA